MPLSTNGSSDGLHFGPVTNGSGSIQSQENPLSLAGSIRSQRSQRSGTNSYRRHDLSLDANSLRHINFSANFSDAISENGEITFQQSQPSQHSQPDASQGLSAVGSQATVTDPSLTIYGTDVNIELCQQKFREFLYHDNFDINSLEPDERAGLTPMEDGSGLALYLQRLEDINTLCDDVPQLEVNCAHIHQFDPDLYRKLVRYPAEVIPAFDMAANKLFLQLYPGTKLREAINVRPYNVIEKDSIRSLNPEDINQLKTITGMVIRVSNIIPEMKTAFFECSICHNTLISEVDEGRLTEPASCSQCNTKYSFQIVHNLCEFIDKQQIKLQESPDEMPAGQTPYTVLLYACVDLVDAVAPGDRVTVTGVYRASSIRTNPRQRTIKSIYRTHLDVVHFRKEDKNRLLSAQLQYKFSPQRIDELKQLSLLPDIYDRLARALAPSIYEHIDIKKGLLLQLFGGTNKQPSDLNNENVKQKHFRSEINILLCGDPGTSKSQLLQYVYKLVPRGQYTSGKGSSAVGLTAYVTRDPDSNQLVLQTGALVLADGGICCIDEFDKMSDSTRSVLHEVMEQQTLSIAKAGIVCQLNARTSILAAANPIESQWNKNRTIVDNIQLPHTLMSRFDLIFLMLDPQDEVYDKRLAKHLVSLYYKTREEAEEEEIMDMELLRDYISYARQNIHPRLSEEARGTLISAYVQARSAGIGKGMVSAYPRQLEALIRLAEAHAKVRLSNVVSNEDVEEAIRLHKEAIKQSATDPVTGRIDLSILYVGMSTSDRKKRGERSRALRELLLSKSKGSSSQSSEPRQFSYTDIFNEFKADSTVMITKEMFEDALKDLQDEGFLTVLAGRFIRICGEA